MKRIYVILLAYVALACVFLPAAFAGEASGDVGDMAQRIAATVFKSADTAIIVLGVAAFAMNQLSQIWAWAADSRMGKIDRLIEGAISFAYLLKGQEWKKKGGKLTLEQGQELADIALEALQGDAAQAGINLEKALGNESRQRSRIQTIFDRMRGGRAKPEGSPPDVPETVAVAG